MEILQGVWEVIVSIFSNSGYAYFFTADGGILNLVMILVAFFFLFLGIKMGFEPLLMVPIAFGMLLANIPDANLAVQYHDLAGFRDLLAGRGEFVGCTPGLMDFLYFGVKAGIYPPLIFLGIGAMTDFGPLIANPKSFILGAAAQFGIFGAYMTALYLGFDPNQAASIAIIGGADGPTAIFLSGKLCPQLMGAVAVCAYSYMALVPVIQPFIMRLLTTDKERVIKMKPGRKVSQTERIIFPVIGLLLTTFIVPSGLPLLGMLFFGNLLKESGKTSRLAKTASSALNDIVVILLGLTVGCSTQASEFLTVSTIKIFVLGAFAFVIATASGVIFVKIMNLFLKKDNKINPLIGNAGVSAVPMAARISNNLGLEYDRHNYLLMHAMGPNVAGVIGSAVAAGTLLGFFS